MHSRYMRAIKKTTKFLSEGVIGPKPAFSYVGGWLGQQNLGDEALFEAMKLLFQRFDLIQFDGGRTHSILTRCFPFIRGGILAGGTLINRDDYWLNIAQQFCRINPNFFVFGTGVAHPSFWIRDKSWHSLLEQWKPLLEKSKLVGVRGPLSAELLYQVGIKNVEVVGDPVIVFAEDKINESYLPNSVGLNIGQSWGNVWGNEEDICDEFVRLACLARQAKWQVRWFVVQPSDLEITQKAAERSGTANEVHELYNDRKKFMELVRPLSSFVGMKLHATILATCSFVPSIMLEYRPKCRDYMKSIGQEAWTFRTDSFRAEEVWEIIASWNLGRQRIAELLFCEVKKLQEKQRERADELIRAMEVIL